MLQNTSSLRFLNAYNFNSCSYIEIIITQKPPLQKMYKFTLVLVMSSAGVTNLI